ncbi:DUF6464 family protein [Trichocoleus sp. FACHB-262]|uniref:DUF6464 family protein n=1 Tax=Trichocoleus sp. FACHB-262 TaxID=2692869 RepID=UPI0016898948|nr:DUF6464 family protein [Trichocoleus sp. FACHB-262]MBD2122234.1 hypothetical protein [Trichocoleus sp. FACHB-262]
MAFRSLFQQSTRTLMRHSNYCLISIMFANLCLALQAGSPGLLTGIVVGSSLLYLPLSLLNLWWQWQQHKARTDELNAQFRARLAATKQKPLGNPHCIYSARSLHIRCAVRPYGPCEDCLDFEPRS